MMPAAHVVVPLGLLHMGRLQGWFTRLRIDPVRQKTRIISVPPSVGADLAHWGNPLNLDRGTSPQQTYVTRLSVHRRITVRVGRDVSVSGGGSTVDRPHVSPHKCAGALHTVEGDTALRSSAAGSARSDPHRQQSCSSQYKWPGRCALCSAAEHWQAAAVLGAHKPALRQSSVHPWHPEQRSRHHVHGGSPAQRLEPPSRSDLSDLEQIQQSSSGSVCYMGERTVPAVFLTESEGGSTIRSGRLCSQPVAKNAPLRFLSGSADPAALRPGSQRAAISDPRSPQAHRRFVVPKSAAAAVRLRVAVAVEGGCDPLSRRGDQELPRDRPESLSLAAERERLEKLGLPQEVVQAFEHQCATKGVDPISCPLACILSFLQQLMNRNLAFSAIKTYAAAISSCHEGFGDRTATDETVSKRLWADTDQCHAH
ncbi:hypothetical protein ATANTOWER_025104 [Ataeniobius toweri]|uniref:Uncharacterized protein n=1 Tax=Ataeniobius toweri TaxID=208326 RepID=A0ABU7CIF0_9TELE|nr:hypothetical protein [Ataeniobius toweri]